MVDAGFPWHPSNHDPEKEAQPPDTSVRDFQLDGHGNDAASLKESKHFHLPFLGGHKDHKKSDAHGHRKSTWPGGPASGFPALDVAEPPSITTQRISARSAVRTIPPWVQSAEESDFPARVKNPKPAVVAQHHHNPSLARKPLLDDADEPSDEAQPDNRESALPESRWATFAKASAYPRENFTGEKVAPEWINEHWGSYSQPWLANHTEDGDGEGGGRYHAFKRKREVWYKRSQYTILRNPFIPLVFRFVVFTFALIALGIGATIFVKTRHLPAEEYQGGPSAEMAVIVDAIALVYIGYITYDEYFSKPLGLRRARAKVRLILLDLFFIVFQTSNLSLAFESMSSETGACVTGPDNHNTLPDICARTRALAVVLLISLIAWLMTFSISVLRLVERINVH